MRNDITLFSVFAAVCASGPDRIAVKDGEGEQTYASLLEMVDHFAAVLVAQGVGAGQNVGLCLPRGRHLPAAMLALLKLGCTYIPMGPTAPAARRNNCIRQADIRHVICEVPEDDIRATQLSLQCLADAVADVDPPTVRPALAAIIFTSGSTGTPKGVKISEAGILRVAHNPDYVSIKAGSRVSCLANPAFDALTFEVFGALLNGGTLCIVSQEELHDPAKLAARFGQDVPDALFLTASLFNLLSETDPGCLAGAGHIIVGGEPVRPASVARFYAANPQCRARIINGYGPTECTTFALTHPVDPDHMADFVADGSIPIGRPIDQTEAYVLHDDDSRADIGEVGRLFLGGVGVADGYLGAPDLTAQKFISKPEISTSQLYDTGDLVHIDAQGLVHYVGRADGQVKIRGHRVELNEVESHLSRHPHLRDAALTMVEVRDSNQLHAVLVAEPGEAPTVTDMRQFLSRTLPPYMIPQRFFLASGLPRTSNGKIDRNALLTCDMQELATVNDDDAPQTAETAALVSIVQQVLCAQAGTGDSFLELGGASLDAMRVVGRLATEHGLRGSVGDLLGADSLGHFAGLLRHGGDEVRNAFDPDAPYPASQEQARLVFLQRLDPTAVAYNETFCFDIDGPLDMDVLQSSLDMLVVRHAALRTGFDDVDGVVQAQPNAPFPVDLRICAEEEARAFCDAPYDMRQGQMLRSAIVQRASETHRLYLGFHHVAIDGHSVTRLLEDLSALMNGTALSLRPTPYQTFAASRRTFRRSDAHQRQLDDWQDELQRRTGGRFAPLFAQVDTRRRPASFHHCAVDANDWQRMKSWSVANGVTVFSVLATIFAKVLAQMTGRADIAIGTPVANRGLGSFGDVVGMCVNTLPLFIDVAPGSQVLGALTAIDRQIKQSLSRQDVDFDEITGLAAGLGQPRALFDAMLVLENTQTDHFAIDNLTVRTRPYLGPETKFPLTIFVTETDAGAQVEMAFCEDEVRADNASAIIEAFQLGVSALPDHDRDTLRTLPAMTPETGDTVKKWSYGPPATSAGGDILAALQRHAEHQPDALAVSDQDHDLTYHALERRSSQIAAGLRRHGVEPGVLVGICLTRSADLVAVLLGVWKAGAAYVPLDPSYPDDRLSYLLSDSAVRFVVTASPHVSALLPSGCLSLSIEDLVGSDGNGGRQIEALAKDDLAYVMYTSGSTGLPKGVEISHGALANYLDHASTVYCSDIETGIVSSGFSFDATLTTLLAPLVAGKSIRLIAQDGAEVISLAKLLQTTDAQLLLKVTPSHLWALRGYLSDMVIDVRHCIVVGGEVFSTELANAFLAIFPNARMINEYGPTETVVGCTYHIHDAVAAERDVPIGKPIAGMRIRVMDTFGTDCSPNVTGQVLIGGRGVGMRYHNRPELTTERFVTLADGLCYYISGDLARWDADGVLQYLGRKDEQFKVRGYRIEPAEVELPLRALPGVSQAAVAVTPSPDGSSIFAGYVVCRDADFNPVEMKASLAQALPAHLVPDVLIAMDALPFTPNGKLDRGSLPAPDSMQRTSLVDAATNADVLGDLCAQIESVIGYAVDPNTNFFEAGMNSLLLMKLHSRLIRQSDIALELIDFFTYPTPNALADFLAGQYPPVVDAAQDSDAQLGEEIAIVGMAVNLPGAADLAAFWENIAQGRTNFAQTGASDASENHGGRVGVSATMEGLFDFDPEYFGLSAADAELMDPQQRLILMGAVHALENAGVAPAQKEGQPVGVYVSSSENQYQQQLIRDEDGISDGFQMSLLNEKDFVSTRIAYHLNLTGPALTVQSACSSSLAAVHIACQQLRLGECGMALAGGVSADPRLMEGYTYRPGRIFSHDGQCRTFGVGANGTVPANGMGLVVLKPLSRAQADGDRIYATIKGSALTNDGHAKVSFTAPSVAGQTGAISKAIAAAHVHPKDIGYIEAHGTGTKLGDPIEFEALSNAFGSEGAAAHCALASVKSQLGHTASAAGVIGLIRTALGVYGQLLPATFGADTPNPHLAMEGSPFYLNKRPRFWQSNQRIAGVSSFGMGGTNAHVIIGNLAGNTPEMPDKPAFLPFSARSEAALTKTVQAVMDRLVEGTHSLAQLAVIQTAARAHYKHRIGFQCQNTSDAMAQLGAYLDTGATSGILPTSSQQWLANLAKLPPAGTANLPLDTVPYAFNTQRYQRMPKPSSAKREPHDTWLYQDNWQRIRRLSANTGMSPTRVFVGTQQPFVQTANLDTLADRLQLSMGDELPEVVVFADVSRPDCLDDVVRGMQLVIGVVGTAPVTVTVVAESRSETTYAGLLRGPLLVVPAEHPNIRVRLLHIPADTRPAGFVAALDALADKAGEFAVQHGCLSRRTLVPVGAEVAGDTDHSGTHLVIGGEGGIGQHVVADLALGGGRIVSLSRSTGTDRLDDCDPTPLGQHAALLRMRGDVTDHEAMHRLAHDIEGRFGKLTSVYHCAGEIGSGPMSQLDPAKIAQGIATKTQGLDVIEAAFLSRAPRRVVICSSMSAQFGLAGQTDYAAANSHACAWAEGMAVTYPDTAVTAIAWPTWRDTGMAATVQLTPELADFAITPAEGMQIMRQAISLGLPSVYVSPVKPDQMAGVFRSFARQTSTAPQSVDSVERAFAQILGVDEIGPRDDFFDLGGDSLSALDLLDLLEPLAPGRVSMAVLQADATVAGLRRCLDRANDETDVSTRVELVAGTNGSAVCIAPIGGDLSGYRNIQTQLAGEVAVEGLRDPVYLGEIPSKRSVAELVHRYRQDMRDIAPKALIGWSFGAMIAWQIAFELEAEGIEAPPLVLIDPPAIGFHANVGLTADDVLASEMGTVTQGPGRDAAFRNAMRACCELNAAAMATFNPSGRQVMAPSRLFVAHDGQVPPPGIPSRTAWLSQSWQSCFKRSLQVQTLDADHYSIMTGARAKHIADVINKTQREGQMEDTFL